VFEYLHAKALAEVEGKVIDVEVIPEEVKEE